MQSYEVMTGINNTLAPTLIISTNILHLSLHASFITAHLHHRQQNGGGGALHTAQRLLENGILTFTLWALHGKKIRQKVIGAPPPPGESRSAVSDSYPGSTKAVFVRRGHGPRTLTLTYQMTSM